MCFNKIRNLQYFIKKTTIPVNLYYKWYRFLYLLLYNLYNSDVTDVTVVIFLRLGAMGDITLYNIYIK